MYFSNKIPQLLITAIFLIFNYEAFSQKASIPVQTNNISLLLQADNSNYLRTMYLGKPLKNTSEYDKVPSVRLLNEQGSTRNNLAYSAAGTNTMYEPAIAVVHTDGNNSLDLAYQRHTVSTSADGATLTTIYLKDRVYDFFVELYYKSWPKEDVIEQWSVISHKEKGKVVLNKFASANLYFYNRDYLLTSYNGGWAREMQPVETELKQGIHSINSKLGTRENLLSSQNFMLSFDGKATEQTGEVLLGQLAWNGNYNIEFEIDSYKNLRLIAGINNYQSAYELKQNERFETPKLIYTLSHEGIGKGSR
ncbi:MAG TPA: glycoside hydrolase family 36 N-terminal domain-containing protein, partial [Sphingobacteriaceae bacterium]